MVNQPIPFIRFYYDIFGRIIKISTRWISTFKYSIDVMIFMSISEKIKNIFKRKGKKNKEKQDSTGNTTTW